MAYAIARHRWPGDQRAAWTITRAMQDFQVSLDLICKVLRRRDLRACSLNQFVTALHDEAGIDASDWYGGDGEHASATDPSPRRYTPEELRVVKQELQSMRLQLHVLMATLQANGIHISLDHIQGMIDHP